MDETYLLTIYRYIELATIVMKRPRSFQDYIDEHLTWKHHIVHVNTQVSIILFFITQIKYILPKDRMRT